MSSTANNGSYSWTIPSSVPTHAGYKIKISDSNDGDIYGSSASLVIDVDLKCRVQFSLSCTDPYDIKENGATLTTDGFTPTVPAVGREVCLQTFVGYGSPETVCATTGSDEITPVIRISRRYPPVHHSTNWKRYVDGVFSGSGAYLCKPPHDPDLFRLSIGGVSEDHGPCDFN